MAATRSEVCKHLEAMLTALDASPRALERIGDWQIVGNNGHIMTDGRGFVFYVSFSLIHLAVGA